MRVAHRTVWVSATTVLLYAAQSTSGNSAQLINFETPVNPSNHHCKPHSDHTIRGTVARKHAYNHDPLDNNPNPLLRSRLFLPRSSTKGFACQGEQQVPWPIPSMSVCSRFLKQSLGPLKDSHPRGTDGILFSDTCQPQRRTMMLAIIAA
jgi:hypothetical protein